jgi:hypothetical protein
MRTSFDLDFIARTLRTAGVVLIIALPFGIYYFGVFPTLSFFFGGIWGMLNLLFLRHLITAVIRPDGVDIPRAVLTGLVKFPLLYVSGYFLISNTHFQPSNLLWGFTAVLGVMVLKVLGRWFLHLDESNSQEPLQKVV